MLKRIKKENQEKKPHFDLLEDIAKTKCALDNAYSNFENAVNPDLIDCYIYEVNAVQKRYKFLMELARQLEVHEEYSLCQKTS